MNESSCLSNFPFRKASAKVETLFQFTKTIFEKILAILKELHSVSEETGLQSYNLLPINSKFNFVKILEVSLSSWAMRDSNPRPPRCKRGALNQLS